MATILPGIGQVDYKPDFSQSNPIDAYYSPRLFGAPPQLTSLCDMRINSSLDGSVQGATGDWYRENVLKSAQVANFVVGRAVFTGGYNSVANVIRNFVTYARALAKYDVYGEDGMPNTNRDEMTGVADAIEAELDAQIEKDRSGNKIPRELGGQGNSIINGAESEEESEEGGSSTDELSSTLDFSTFLTTQSNGGDEQEASIEFTTISWDELYNRTGDDRDDWKDYSTNGEAIKIAQLPEEADNYMNQFNGYIPGLLTSLKASLSLSQPYYTFESDWASYINNVKMMINAAVVMLGLQSSAVRIGDKIWPIGMDVKYAETDDIWSNYRYITCPEGQEVSTSTSIDNDTGDTNQYVSFMIDPTQGTESYNNTIGESQLFSSVVNQGSSVGSEIAFIAGASRGVVDDTVIRMAGGGVSVAEAVISNLSSGVGRFSASIMAATARSYLGDHPIYPKIFQSHQNGGSVTINVKLRASRGDAYTYLIDVLVPLFHILCLVMPKMSDYSAGAYEYPPLIQCQIPGLWGTRLGMVQSVSVTKNPDTTGLSVNGFPLSINVGITVEDLCHCMVTTGMETPAKFLNNNTMFDYIAQCTGVDRYRANPAARMVTKLALAGSYTNNFFYYLGEGLTNAYTTLVNKHTRVSQY